MTLVRRFSPAWAVNTALASCVVTAAFFLLVPRGPIAAPLQVKTARSIQAASAPFESPEVSITADDGHRSVFTEMLPLVREYDVPVTLFIYPSAISNASYAMTWDQLESLRRTGLFDIQS